MARKKGRGRTARVFLVDDHPIVREGLSQLIDRDPRLQVCGDAPSPASAMRLIRDTRPDVVVTDLYFPQGSGLDLIKEIRAAFPQLPVLVLSVRDESIYAESALHAGAGGYVMKDEAGERIRDAIHKVLDGEVYLSETISRGILHKFVHRSPGAAASPAQSLSDRELQVFEMIGQGLGISDIARALHLSPKTIETHRSKIKVKLDLNDATELRRQAIQWVQSQGLV